MSQHFKCFIIHSVNLILTVTHKQYCSLGTDTARQGLSAARLCHTGALLLAWGVQAGTCEEAGPWRVDQRAWTAVHLLATLLGAVKLSPLTHTVKGSRGSIKVSVHYY